MSAKDGFENDLLKHLFQNANIPNIGDSTGLRGSSAAGSFYVAAYVVSPDDSASGTEASYTGYERAAVERSVSGFSVVGNVVSNAAIVSLPQMTTGDLQQIRGFAICNGATKNVDDQIIWGALESIMDVNIGTTPRFAIGDLSVNVD